MRKGWLTNAPAPAVLRTWQADVSSLVGAGSGSPNREEGSESRSPHTYKHTVLIREKGGGEKTAFTKYQHTPGPGENQQISQDCTEKRKCKWKRCDLGLLAETKPVGTPGGQRHHTPCEVPGCRLSKGNPICPRCLQKQTANQSTTAWGPYLPALSVLSWKALSSK